VEYHDPHVLTWDAPDTTRLSDDELPAAVASADLVVLVQKHSFYDLAALAANAMCFFDTTGSVPGATAL